MRTGSHRLYFNNSLDKKRLYKVYFADAQLQDKAYRLFLFRCYSRVGLNGCEHRSEIQTRDQAMSIVKTLRVQGVSLKDEEVLETVEPTDDIFDQVNNQPD